jgi:glycosyltransferase involved in cell wall biosynthesis
MSPPDVKQKRIFVDCTLIDFTRQPTGIPRVVTRYLETGYDFSRETGHIVVPTLINRGGLFVVRPVPGGNPTPLAKAMAGGNVNAFVKSEIGPQFSEDVVRIYPKAGDLIFSAAYWHDVDPWIFFDAKANGAKVVTLVYDNAIKAIQYSDWMFTISNYTREGLIELAARAHLKIPRITTIRNAFEPIVDKTVAEELSRISRPRSRNAVELDLMEQTNPYVMVGSVEPKKGHVPTILTFETLWQSGYQRPLCIIGRPGWKEREVIETIKGSPFYRSKLFWYAAFDDLDLYYAYKYCHGMVFSSIAEGFGIPMIEAASYNTPVLAFDTEINREVAKDFATIFKDGAELASYILSWEDEKTHKAAVSRTDNFRWHTWDECGPVLFNFLCDIIDGDAPSTALLY